MSLGFQVHAATYYAARRPARTNDGASLVVRARARRREGRPFDRRVCARTGPAPEVGKTARLKWPIIQNPRNLVDTPGSIKFCLTPGGYKL